MNSVNRKQVSVLWQGGGAAEIMVLAQKITTDVWEPPYAVVNTELDLHPVAMDCYSELINMGLLSDPGLIIAQGLLT